MIALQVSDVRQFMVKLFYQPVFDPFYIKELTIRTFFDFSINGHRNLEFYPLEEQEAAKEHLFVSWREVKNLVFQMIKGNRTPLAMHLVFQFSKEATEDILKLCGSGVRKEEQVGLYINVRFENGKLMLVSGVSREEFTLDKTLEHVFEEELKQFLKQAEIAFE